MRKNIVTVQLLAVVKEKQLCRTQITQKISRFRSTLPYLSSEYHNLCHYHTADNLISDHSIKPFQRVSQFLYLIFQCNLIQTKKFQHSVLLQLSKLLSRFFLMLSWPQDLACCFTLLANLVSDSFFSSISIIFCSFLNLSVYFFIEYIFLLSSCWFTNFRRRSSDFSRYVARQIVVVLQVVSVYMKPLPPDDLGKYIRSTSGLLLH